MPIYEYACESCGHQFDALQKMSDDPLRECPDCGEKSLKKLLSAPNFRLKGGGWYETDFKKDKQRNLAGESKDDGSAGKKDPDKKDSDKADKKSSSKSEQSSSTSDKSSSEGKSGGTRNRAA